MERLLGMAKKVCDKAEVYSIEGTENLISFKDARFHDIESTFRSGVSLRIIKDSKLGFAYTRNLMNREELLQNALISLKGGVEVNYDFPLTKEIPQLDTYDSSFENLSTAELVEECTRVSDLLKSKIDGEISKMASFTHIEGIRIMNSKGADASTKGAEYGFLVYLTYPGSGLGFWRVFRSKKLQKMPDDIVREMIKLYNLSTNVVEPKGGRMKVMFMPNSMVALYWRILSGTSSKSVYEKISPIADKAREKIFNEKITIYDDPLNDKYPKARSFDDEGVTCRPLTIIENGVLKGFYSDLNYANKLNTESTGHGYRTTENLYLRFSADPLTLKPVPALTHMTIKPGDKSFWDLVKSMDRGIIIEGILGAHSGNIPNGDYSVGVCPGLYVEDGEIIGRVKDAMVAGNVYETLKHVIDLGDTLYPSFMGSWVPAVLCDNVSVTTKE